MTKIFAKRLREAREATGLSRAKLAEISGVAAITIYNYETKKFSPTLYCAVALADILNVSLDWLAGRDEK